MPAPDRVAAPGGGERDGGEQGGHQPPNQVRLPDDDGGDVGLEPGNAGSRLRGE